MEIRMLLWNHADESEDFARKVATTTMFQHLVDDLMSQQTEHKQEMLSVSYESQESFAFNSTMGIINNCARNAETRNVFTVSMPSGKKINMVDCLQPFLAMENKYVKLITLLALSHIMNEEENRKLTADKTILEFLLEMLSKAADSNDKRHFGFSVHELVDGLANFAKNDNNKYLLMDMKALDLLRRIIMKGSIIEQTAVAKALWELAFLKKNREIILKDKELYKLLQKLKTHDVEELKNAADGACFVIDQKDAPAAVKKEPPKSAKRDGHIMISYNWADQKVLIRIKEWLMKDGFNVWMDIENMEGSLLESMARGIENASVVLLCYSEKYKDSQNCRTEAEYTYKLKKETIPLRMQTNYAPDGWLGILIGSKLFYDFSGVKYPIESKYKELLRALNNQDSIPEEPTAISKLQSATAAMSLMGPVKSSAPASQPLPANVHTRPHPPTVNTARWTKEDISRWLKDNRLETFSGLKSLSGEQIAFLYKMFYRAPESFYRCIQEKLGMKSLEELMRFSDAIESLEYMT
ncbi:hypothetical protein FSP39_022570 [Pinctada imbricata]|uniref:TIR domain-containing protein n=1 Tax=Pinctada imbricata TaxID=66713 RepID=A0AA88Y6B2_PINIB|nr:hypothetical protein FSP39_022570 [Pinctada imbricata]